MLKLRDGIVELYKKVATSIPPDVEDAIKKGLSSEEDSRAKESLSRILDNIGASRQAPRPSCADTGVPIFRVKVPRGLSHVEMRNTIREATVVATQKIPLVPAAVDILTGENSGDNTGTGFPIIYLEEVSDDTLTIDLMLRSAESEYFGRTYRLPLGDLQAERDLEGVRKCVVDSVRKAGGRGCPPYTVGVGIGASQDQVSVLATHQLFRKIPDENPNPAIAELEQKILNELNELGIGPMGVGGRTTALGVKIGVNHRHPESYLVYVSLSCWANRRGRLIW
ncbi:MAG TPA: fumarate hydratase [Thermodesulfovibrionales bacterium]|nr:fumarate hydratase [Thermodesulfovibrionales bacterium]